MKVCGKLNFKCDNGVVVTVVLTATALCRDKYVDACTYSTARMLRFVKFILANLNVAITHIHKHVVNKQFSRISVVNLKTLV